MKSLTLLGLFVFQVASASTLPAEVFPIVTFETSMGSYDVELNSEKAPISVKNFLDYVDSGFYVQTVFHRVVPKFVIQGGGLDANLQEKPTRDPIVNEAKNGLSNVRYSLGMAREDAINTATAQFYINTKDNLFLDYRSDDHYGYAVFGKVISGFDVIDAIEIVSTHTVGEYEGVPMKPILILSVKRR